MKIKLGALLLALTSTVCHPVEPPSAESGLTPVGAIRAGNSAGTIPPWTGGITTPPASYRPGQHETDPFAEDVPLFQITAANAQQYVLLLME